MGALAIFLLYAYFVGLISGTTADDGFGNDLWRRKFKTYAAALDHNRDGFVTYAEIEANEDDYKKLYHGDDIDLPRSFSGAMDDLWHAMSGNAPSGTEISYDQAADGMEAAGQAQCQSILARAATAAFPLTDTNGDGKMDFTETEQMYNTFVLTNPNDVADAFKVMDSDGDGYISTSDQVKSVLNFFCTGEDHPSDVLWGPLQD